MIKKIDYSQLEDLIPLAKKDGITYLEECEFLGYYQDFELVATVGWTKHKNKFVLRNDYVKKEYRRKGIYRTLNQTRLTLLQNFGIKILEIRCTPMSYELHREMGAVPIKKYKNYIHLNYYL